MKNILAENLLRFGLKNADATVVNKLQSLSEQDQVRDNMPSADMIKTASKIDPVLAKLLVSTSEPAGQTITVLGDKYVIEVKPSRKDGYFSYQYAEYSLYKIAVAGGLPWIFRAVFLGARGQGTNDNDFIPEFNQKFSDIDGNGNVAKLNNNWNDSEFFSPEVIKKAFELIQRNQAAYKTEYQKFTRSESAIKSYWKPNLRAWKYSQYFKFLGMLKDNARSAIDLVQDTELYEHIIYKTKNFAEDGKYPNLPIPAAVTV